MQNEELERDLERTEEQENCTPVEEKEYRLPRWCLVLLSIAAVALVLYLLAMLIPTLADGYNSTVGAFFRALLAHLTSFLPFSLAEILLFSLPVLVVLLGVVIYRRHSETLRDALFFLTKLLCAVSVLFSTFVFSFGVGYHTHTLDERIFIRKFLKLILQILHGILRHILGLGKLFHFIITVTPDIPDSNLALFALLLYVF